MLVTERHHKAHSNCKTTNYYLYQATDKLFSDKDQHKMKPLCENASFQDNRASSQTHINTFFQRSQTN